MTDSELELVLKGARSASIERVYPVWDVVGATGTAACPM